MQEVSIRIFILLPSSDVYEECLPLPLVCTSCAEERVNMGRLTTIHLGIIIPRTLAGIDRLYANKQQRTTECRHFNVAQEF